MAGDAGDAGNDAWKVSTNEPVPGRLQQDQREA